MNQPSSACSSWTDNLSHLHHHTSGASNHTNTCLLDWHQPDSHSDMGLEADNAFTQNKFEPNNSDATHIPFNRDQNCTPVPVVDSHPNIPSVYPGRTTFMDQFFADEYSRFRQENLYYPFASETDWQLVSWLLRSCLSMATIDTFLLLELVCLFVFYFHFQANSKLRSSSFPSPLDWQRNYGFVQRGYLQVPAGNLMFSIPRS